MEQPSTRTSVTRDPDGESCGPVLTEDMLLQRFAEKPLSALLLASIDPKSLSGLSNKLRLNPLPGKRLKTMRAADHALLLARISLEQDKTRRAVLTTLNERLPPPLFVADVAPPSAEVDRWISIGDSLTPELRLAVALAFLRHEELAPRVVEAIETGWLGQPEEKPDGDGDAELEKMRAKAAKAEQRAAKAEEAARAERKAVEDRERSMKQRLESMQAELAELQQRVGEKNRENEQLRSMQEELKNDVQVAFRRAARFKHQLDDMKSSSERETELREAYAREKQRAEIELAKVEILEYQLDLADQEEHDDATETQEASTHDATAERVSEYIARHGRSPRLLIVGGAGKQRSHRERDFAQLKERLGFDGEWRFAEYGSWHRELPRLRNDIKDRYDLVFVLHWNRTTFVQKMHDEARALNGRVRTVPYRGFLSLENAVTEELVRFINEQV